MSRRLLLARRVSAALLLAVALLAGAHALALAHGALVSASPAANSTVAASPRTLHLVFSEPLEVALARVSIEGADGRVVRLHPAGDPHDVNALDVPVDSLAAGAWRVIWRVVSADGHPVGGSFVFRVAPTAAGAAQDLLSRAAAMHDSSMRRSPMHDSAHAAPAPPEVELADEATAWGPSVLGAPAVAAALRGLAVGALMALAGLLAFIGHGASDARRAVRLATRLAVAAPLLLALHLAAWLIGASADHSLPAAVAGGAMGGGVGRVELWRTGLALLALWALWLARRPRLALVFAALALVVSGATGHAAAIRPLLAAPAKAVHLLAGAAWIGGLLWLLVRDHDDAAAFAHEAARVSIVALVSIVAVTVSGLGEAFLFLPSPLDAVRSAYGAVALAKVGGLVALALFGVHHRNRLLPRLGDAAGSRALAASVRRETAVMGLVVLLGGLLAYVPTPAAPAAHGPHVTHTTLP